MRSVRSVAARWSVFCSLPLFCVAALAAEPALQFGPPGSPGFRKGIHSRQAAPLEVTVADPGPRGEHALNSLSVLVATGGGLLVNSAEPEASLSDVPLRLEYQPDRPDGERVVVVAGERQARLPLYDWEAAPQVRFVESGHHGAVSILVYSGGAAVSLDVAFQGTLLGLRFVQADLMARNILVSQKYLPRTERGLLLGAGERDRLGNDASVADAIKEAGLLLRSTGDTSYAVLTDAGVPFVFSIEGDRLTVSGTPYWFFWDLRGDKVVPRRELNAKFAAAWPVLKKANPLVIEAMERSFGATAFFRHQKATRAENWATFARRLAEVRVEKAPTPDRLARE